MIFALALLAGPARALTVNVSPGDDLASVTASLAAGDEIVFADGVYPVTSTLSWTGAGTQQAPIVLRAATGARPIIELNANKDGNWASEIAYLSDASFVELRGIVFRGGSGWDADGTSFSGLVLSNTSDVVLQDVEVSDTGRDSLVLSNDNTRLAATRLHLHDTRDGDGLYAGCGDASCWLSDSVIANAWIHGIRGQRHALYLAHGAQGNSIVDTVVYDVEYRGLYLGSTESGAPNIVERDAFWQIGNWAMTVYGAARVRNNLVFQAGAGIYAADPDRGTYSNVVISYNTVVDTDDNALQLEDWTNASGMVLSSNALCNPIGMAVEVGRDAGDTGASVPFSDARITNNVVCGYVSGLSVDEGQILAGDGWGDFLDVPGWSLYPSQDSVLRDAGDPAGEAWVPDVDFNGTPRSGAAPDAGAYEWTQADNPGWTLQQSYKDLGANNITPPAVLGGCCHRHGGNGSGDTGGAALLLPLGALVGVRRLRRRDLPRHPRL